jgi:hypothetical protein
VRISLGFARHLVVELRRPCRHQVPGVCPQCFPAEARTVTARKLSMALAWLDRLQARDASVNELEQLRQMARDAYNQVADLGS